MNAKLDKYLAVCHSRKKFYHGKDVYWYEFPECRIKYFSKFLQVPETIYYEYGGTHAEALKDLKREGFKITEGEEI